MNHGFVRFQKCPFYRVMFNVTKLRTDLYPQFAISCGAMWPNLGFDPAPLSWHTFTFDFYSPVSRALQGPTNRGISTAVLDRRCRPPGDGHQPATPLGVGSTFWWERRRRGERLGVGCCCRRMRTRFSTDSTTYFVDLKMRFARRTRQVETLYTGNKLTSWRRLRAFPCRCGQENTQPPPGG